MFLFAGHKNMTEKKQLLFNVEEMKASIQNYLLLSQAKLRLRVKDPTIQRGLPQRLEIFKGLNSAAQYLGYYDISNDLINKWISIDVTATVKEWLQSDGKSFHISLASFKDEPASVATLVIQYP